MPGRFVRCGQMRLRRLAGSDIDCGRGGPYNPLMECSVHTLTCDVIEVADDGRSVRGSFVTPGAIHSTLDEKHRYNDPDIPEHQPK